MYLFLRIMCQDFQPRLIGKLCWPQTRMCFDSRLIYCLAEVLGMCVFNGQQYYIELAECCVLQFSWYIDALLFISSWRNLGEMVYIRVMQDYQCWRFDTTVWLISMTLAYSFHSEPFINLHTCESPLYISCLGWRFHRHRTACLFLHSMPHEPGFTVGN